MEYVWLAVLWTAWCVLHSVLASRRVSVMVQRHFPVMQRYYRLLYNIIAVVTLVPVLAYSFSISGVAFLHWQGGWVVLQVIMIIGGLALFIAPLKQYDMARFMGWQQIASGDTHKSLAKDNKLDTSGILGYVRHPWYTGALLLIWARDLDTATLIVNVIITTYFLLGAMLEERKLVLEMGDAYRRYQENVGMFVPRGWWKLGRK